MGTSGEFVVTWYGLDSANKDSIFVQKFNAQGQPVPGAVLVNPGAPTPVYVRSSEAGTAYLVQSSVTVTTLADITSAADALWNQVAITAANTDTTLPTTGLGDGTYHVYTADAAGNLSAPSGTVTVDGTAPWANSFTATATAVGATSTESGILGLYDGSNTLLAKAGDGTFSVPMAANTAASIALQAQTSATTATLKVLDAAGNVAADTRTVMLGTGGDDTALAGTGGADFLFGFAGNDRFVFNAVFGSSSDSHLNTGVDTITDLAAGDVIVANLGNVGTFDASSSNYVVTNRWAGGNLLILDASGTDNDGTNDAGSIRIDIRDYDRATAAAQVQYHITGTSGADTIVTGGQNDTITGGEGHDTLTGGAGADTFAYVAGDASSRSYTGVGGDAPYLPVSGSQYSNLEVITDFSTADRLMLGNASLSGILFPGDSYVQQNDLEVLYGQYNMGTGTFTVGDQGTPGVSNGDAIVLWDGNAAAADVQLEAVVLVGVDLTMAATLTGQNLTFAITPP